MVEVAKTVLEFLIVFLIVYFGTYLFSFKKIKKYNRNKMPANIKYLVFKYNIDVVTHIMVGLPNESFDDIKNTIDFINNHNIQGLKIHCTYVVENTVLASMYYNGTYTPISLEYYLECAGYILSHINPNIVIHRVSGDAPKDLLVAPDWNSHKKWIMNGLDKYLCENDLWQGKYYI